MTLAMPVSPAPAQACIVCGHGGWSARFAGLVECTRCGFVRAEIEIGDQLLQELYGERYFNGGEYADYLAERAVHRKNFERRFERMQGLAGRLESIFEVGCAYGLWLEYVASCGVRCAGVDVCREAVAYARDHLGQQAVSGDFPELGIEPGTYQAFVMWDTIEHLAHPERFVARIADLLPAGGWLFLTTGDIGSRNARRRGRRWRMIHPPTHLHYFSQATIRRFLAGHGFEVRAVESAAIYRNLRATLANLRVLGKGPLARLAGVVARMVPEGLQERVGSWVDLGDVMFVGARKIRA